MSRKAVIFCCMLMNIGTWCLRRSRMVTRFLSLKTTKNLVSDPGCKSLHNIHSSSFINICSVFETLRSMMSNIHWCSREFRLMVLLSFILEFQYTIGSQIISTGIPVILHTAYIKIYVQIPVFVYLRVHDT